MTSRNLSHILGALVIGALLSGCKSDPQATAREHFEKGNKQLAQEKFPEAIIEYRRAIQSDPRLGPARLQLAHAYASTGDGANALREYARAAELMPDNDEAQIKAGNFMLLAGQYADAQGVAQRLLERKRDHVQAQILLANSLAGLRDVEGALAALEKAAALDPSRAATYSELGLMQFAHGDKAEAEAAFRKAIEIDPKSPAARLALANYLLANRQVEPAVAEIRRALELEPGNLVANRAMALYYVNTGKPEAAEPHLKTVAERMTGPAAKYGLAEYYVRMNRLDDARAILTPLASADATFVSASLRLARLEALQNRNAEAHRLLDAVSGT